jgi:uncharacterized iron-regulated membrane protein
MALVFKKGKLRSLILWVHRWLGLISGIVVFIVAITGCLYVFEAEGHDLFQHKYLYVSPGAAKMPLAQLSNIVAKNYPKETITQIRFKEAADAAIIYFTKSKNAISINPYTGAIIGVRDMEADFFNWIEEMHVKLHLGKPGKQIIKFNVLIFFILCISGLIIWWPKQKKFFKQAATIHFKTKNWKRFNWDLHSVLGFYALSILLVVSLTGIFWVFDWAKQLTAFATSSKISKAPENSGAKNSVAFTLENAYEQSKQLYPIADQVFLSYPPKPKDPIRVIFLYPYNIVRKQNTLFFDKGTGAILRQDLYKNYSTYDKIAKSNYDFHTGGIQILGIGSKIIYFLASLIAASLPITGFLIWWGRGKKSSDKKISNKSTEEETKTYSMQLN